MSLVALGYPSISEKDMEWIQGVRALHDRLYYRVVAPHFTIVFQVTGIDSELFSDEIKKRAAGIEAIPFVLRCALTVEGILSAKQTHVFLVPDEGFSSIVKLHDRLYSGRLAGELRLDIPFIPHVGIGNSIDPHKCKELADELNSRPLAIKGTLQSLDIASFIDGKVKTIEQIMLQ